MNYKIKELEEYVEYRWEAIKQFDNVMQYEKEYEGKVSDETNLKREVSIAKWITANKILEFFKGLEKHLIEEKK